MEITLLFIGAFVFIFAICLQLYSHFVYLPKANKIAKFINEKNYEEAIKLGESIKKLNSVERLNLIGAYFASGNKEKAKILAKDLKINRLLPKI